MSRKLKDRNENRIFLEYLEASELANPQPRELLLEKIKVCVLYAIENIKNSNADNKIHDIIINAYKNYSYEQLVKDFNYLVRTNQVGNIMP